MDSQPRKALIEARRRRHWTQKHAAGHIGCDHNTLHRWERGEQTPSDYYIERLCKVYGTTPAGLGLEKPSSIAVPQREDRNHIARAAIELFNTFLQGDIELRLQSLLCDWLAGRRTSGYEELQRGVFRETGDTMPEHDMLSRRAALRRLALLPVKTLGLSALGAMICVPEEVLPRCAAGIAACAQLAKGLAEDMSLALAMLDAYLPTLEAIVKESSQYRQEASRLVGQCLLMKATLSVHKEGAMAAATYGVQALEYGKESKNIPLQLIILRKLAWVYSCAKQEPAALERVSQADALLRQAIKDEIPVSPLVQSSVLGGVAKYRAQNHKDGALSALRDAHAAFFTSHTFEISGGFIYTEYDKSTLIMDDGLTHYYTGQYDKAFDSFSQAIDPKTQTAKIPLSSDRIRVEIINHETLASLKLPKKDMDQSIALWQTGIQGAKTLQSEQRFREALTAYDMMEALWPGDKRITSLRDLTRHW